MLFASEFDFRRNCRNKNYRLQTSTERTFIIVLTNASQYLQQHLMLLARSRCYLHIFTFTLYDKKPRVFFKLWGVRIQKRICKYWLECDSFSIWRRQQCSFFSCLVVNVNGIIKVQNVEVHICMKGNNWTFLFTHIILQIANKEECFPLTIPFYCFAPHACLATFYIDNVPCLVLQLYFADILKKGVRIL